MSCKPAVDSLKWLAGLVPVAKLLKGAGYKTTKLDLHRADEVHAAVERLADKAQKLGELINTWRETGVPPSLRELARANEALAEALAAFRGDA